MTDFNDLAELRQDFRRTLTARGRRPGTVTSYLEVLDQFIEWLREEERSTDAREITRADVEDYLVFTADRPQKRYRWKNISKASVHKHYANLRQFWRYVEEEEIIVVSPMAKMKPPSLEEKIIPVLTADEIKKLLAACSGTGFRERRDTALLLFMLDTGARASEVAGVMLAEMDFVTDTTKVTGKGRKERVAVFGDRTANAIRRYLRIRSQHPRSHLPALWLGERSNGLTDHGIRDILTLRGQQAGVPGLHPHRFRHTFAHRFLAAGGQETDLMLLAGWSSNQMVARYGRSAAAERAVQAHRRLRIGDDF